MKVNKKEISGEDMELLEMLNRRPEIKKRMLKLAKISVNEIEGCETADDAEDAIAEVFQEMGKELLGGWAKEMEENYAKELKGKEGKISMRGKKN